MNTFRFAYRVLFRLGESAEGGHTIGSRPCRANAKPSTRLALNTDWFSLLACLLITPGIRAQGRIAEMRLALLTVPLLFVNACAHLDSSVEGRAVPVCGSIRFLANGDKVEWGAIFDRPTPELYHAESQKFINRTALAGGSLFRESVERDGTFCWQLPTGTYYISRIVPFQGSSPATLDDRRVFVFPGVAFRADATMQPVYVGILQIAVSVRKDIMGNRWMTGKPSVEILDEFARDRSTAKDRFGEMDKKLMVRIPDLEDVPFHPAVPEIPAMLQAVPWFLLLPH